jgi:signal transduction histidine kinase
LSAPPLERWSVVDVVGYRPHRAASPQDDTEALRRRLMRLAYDVHDGPMQSMVAVGSFIRELRADAAAADVVDRDELVAELTELLEELVSAEASLRGLMTRLEHGHPEIDPVAEIIASQVAAFSARGDTVVTVQAPNFQPDSASQAIAIRAVLREALTNVAKHAHASHVEIRVDPTPAGILLEIEDDGRGFDSGEVRDDALGITGMRDRVELLDGEFAILSRPGGPTIVTARFERWDGAAAA